MKTKLVLLTLALVATTPLLTAQEDGQRPPRREGGPGGPGPGPGPGGMRPLPIVEAIDLNKDGTLDADEIAKAAASLKTLDKNGDGKLTPDEYRPTRPGGAGGPGGRGGPGGPGGRGGPGGGNEGRPPRAQPE